jgi:hypothetical protein
MLPIYSQGGLEVIKIVGGDGKWHIDQCPLVPQSKVPQCKNIHVLSVQQISIHIKQKMGFYFHIILVLCSILIYNF